MKSSIKTIGLVATITVTAFAGVAQANQQPSEDALVQVCESIQENNTLKLRHLMKQHGLNFRAIENGLKCNGQTPIEFAVEHGANEVADKIASRVSTTTDLIAKL